MAGIFHFYDRRGWVEEGQAAFCQANKHLQSDNPMQSEDHREIEPQEEQLLASIMLRQAWFDFRNTTDKLGVDWWQNSQLAVQASRQFAIDNPSFGYSDKIWGLTACDGPWGYKAYGALPAYWHEHDGTIAPTGMGNP